MSLPSGVDILVNPQEKDPILENDDLKATEKSRQCPVCHVYYKYGNSYWQHVRYVHASSLIQCVICEKSYKRTTMAKHHILHSHKIAWHLCGNYVRKILKSDVPPNQEVKSKSESSVKNLKFFKKKTLHLISCFNCYDCPGSFASIDELFEHVRIHREKENYSEYEDSDEMDDNLNENHIEEVHEEVHNNTLAYNEGSMNGDVKVNDNHVFNYTNYVD